MSMQRRYGVLPIYQAITNSYGTYEFVSGHDMRIFEILRALKTLLPLLQAMFFSRIDH